MENNRGSEWRKWDLHLHSPYTNINNKYGDITDEEFIEKIIKENIEVIGLTNYFNFSNEDFELKEKLEQKGIVVFLNLELRLNNINDEGNAVDYHIIFSNELSKEEIKNVLANIKASIGNTTKCLNMLSKEEIKIGVVDLNELHNILNNESLHIDNKYLTAFLSRGHGNAKCGKGRKFIPYEEITRKTDIVMHSSMFIENLNNDKNFWLGKTEQKNKYIKPLLQTSDAHNISDIGVKKKSVEDKNKNKNNVYEENGKYYINVPYFSWIKSDKTFNGLKQVIYEPNERVQYGSENPDNKPNYLVIDSIDIKMGIKYFLVVILILL